MALDTAAGASLQSEIDRAEETGGPDWRLGRGDAWWWLGLPLVLTPLLVAIYAIDPVFYATRVLPEGFGYLELSHFFVPLTAALICFSLLRRPFVRGWPLVAAATILFGVACLFIAGEEHSWGQHFFHWQTPEYWAEINRQRETNLHNTSRLFNQIPEKVLQIGILVGGIFLPLIGRALGGFTHWTFQLFVPPLTLLPVSLAALFFYIAMSLNENFGITLVQRPSEAAETFYYLFLLFYVIVWRRRLTLIEEQRGRGSA